MSAIEIRKVESRSDLRTFIEFHYDLYEGNEYDAPNLYTDEVNTLRKDKNAAFDFCEAEYFIAYKDGKVVGRVAAIINNSANEKWQRKAVRGVKSSVQRCRRLWTFEGYDRNNRSTWIHRYGSRRYAYRWI